MRGFLVLLLLLAAGPTAAAAFPGYINYQGKLGNPAGSPLSGVYSFRFRLYSQATGGTLLATDANYTGANAVTVTNGLYSVQIGSLTAGGLLDSVFHGSETWLEIDVSPGTDFTGSETLAPRERLAAVPFAFRAATSDKLGTGVAIATFTAAGNLDLPYGVNAATMTTTGAIAVGAAGYQFSGRPVTTAITSPVDNRIRLTSGVSQAEFNVTDAAVIIGEPASGAPPLFKTLRATSGDGANNTGSSLIVAAGAGSGTGLGGSIIFQSSTGTVAGSVTQSYLEHARITPFGTVGLGTDVPATKLDVNGDAQFGTTRKSTMTATGEIVSPSSITASAFFGDGSNLTGIGIGAGETNTYASSKTFTGDVLISTPAMLRASSATFTYGITAGTGTFSSGIGIGAVNRATKLHMSSGTLTIDGNVATSLTTTGSVGIGTANPGNTLDVNGGLTVSGTAVIAGQRTTTGSVSAPTATAVTLFTVTDGVWVVRASWGTSQAGIAFVFQAGGSVAAIASQYAQNTGVVFSTDGLTSLRAAQSSGSTQTITWSASLIAN